MTKEVKVRKDQVAKAKAKAKASGKTKRVFNKDTPCHKGKGTGLGKHLEAILKAAHDNVSSTPGQSMDWGKVCQEAPGNTFFVKELAEFSPNKLSVRLSDLKRALKGKGPYARNEKVLALLAKYGFKPPREDAVLTANDFA